MGNDIYKLLKTLVRSLHPALNCLYILTYFISHRKRKTELETLTGSGAIHGNPGVNVTSKIKSDSTLS